MPDGSQISRMVCRLVTSTFTLILRVGSVSDHEAIPAGSCGH